VHPQAILALLFQLSIIIRCVVPAGLSPLYMPEAHSYLHRTLTQGDAVFGLEVAWPWVLYVPLLWDMEMMVEPGCVCTRMVLASLNN